jgi:hypothetical protein
MPIFDFGDWPQVSCAEPGFHILAMMCYPKNSIRRHELYAALATERVMQEAKNPVWSRPLSFEDVSPLLEAVRHGRALKQVIDATRLANNRGGIAGEVLGLIRWSAAHGYQGSVRKAVYILTELAKRTKATGRTAFTLGMTKITTTTPNGIMRAWSHYKDVAHFWAAHNLMVSWHAQDAGDRILPPVVSWFEDTDSFLEFLALTEDFRQFGEGYIPPPADEPVLNARTTWRVPEHVHLPVLGLFNPPPLPQEILDALASYRA